jgi:hypothetical protein
MTRPTLSTSVAAALVGALLLAGCGGSSHAALSRERKAAIKRAHPTFPVAPCSLLSVRQVSAALGVTVHTQKARVGCIYTGTTAGHDQRSLTVTPGTKPASGQLISAAITHAVSITGSGFHGRAGSPPTPGDVRVPRSAVAGIVVGDLYVSLFVQDANPNAPSQVSRAVTLAGQAGRRLVASVH